MDGWVGWVYWIYLEYCISYSSTHGRVVSEYQDTKIYNYIKFHIYTHTYKVHRVQNTEYKSSRKKISMRPESNLAYPADAEEINPSLSVFPPCHLFIYLFLYGEVVCEWFLIGWNGMEWVDLEWNEWAWALSGMNFGWRVKMDGIDELDWTPWISRNLYIEESWVQTEYRAHAELSRADPFPTLYSEGRGEEWDFHYCGLWSRQGRKEGDRDGWIHNTEWKDGRIEYNMANGIEIEIK